MRLVKGLPNRSGRCSLDYWLGYTYRVLSTKGVQHTHVCLDNGYYCDWDGVSIEPEKFLLREMRAEDFPLLTRVLIWSGACQSSVLKSLDLKGDAEALYHFALEYAPDWMDWVKRVNMLEALRNEL